MLRIHFLYIVKCPSTGAAMTKTLPHSFTFRCSCRQ